MRTTQPNPLAYYHHSVVATLGMGVGKALVKRWKRWVGKRKDDIYVCDEEEQTNHEYCLPVGTLPAIAVNGQQDSSIPSPKQHSSTCDRSVVLSGLADVPCPDLGIDIDAMLEKFDESPTPVMSYNLEKEQTKQEYYLPEVALSAITENGQEDLSNHVLKRQSSAEGRPITPSGLADVPCRDLGVDAVLEELAENEQQDASISKPEQHSSAGSTLIVPSGLTDLSSADLDIIAVFRSRDPASIETGRPESSIPVPKQRWYTTPPIRA
ncbi:hypothetical protein ARMGADRAFT_1169761 [Armillaria gallica]|uniref:Uncharacterized protein n=1 Tax=Armillaria gallica TaxID=47427 RepID=A0A2H3D7D5_ARMGA|nr:hypothetical protein ARMGADRAFT_1169761 [Armillaria gallica]